MRVLLAVAFLFVAPAAAQASQQQDLDAARAQWAAEGLDDYRLTVRVGCFCPAEYTRAYVVHVRRGEPYEPIEYVRSYASVPRLFATVQRAIDGDGAVDVTYGPRGLPTRIGLDPIPEAVDDESTIFASRLHEEDEQPPHVPDASIQDGSAATALREARARWKERGLRDYRFRLRRSCFCTPESLKPFTVTARDGRAEGDGLSVPDLFGVVEDAIRGGAAVLRVRYAKSGMPRAIAIDRQFMIADEEIAYRAWRLRPLR